MFIDPVKALNGLTLPMPSVLGVFDGLLFRSDLDYKMLVHTVMPMVTQRSNIERFIMASIKACLAARNAFPDEKVFAVHHLTKVSLQDIFPSEFLSTLDDNMLRAILDTSVIVSMMFLEALKEYQLWPEAFDKHIELSAFSGGFPGSEIAIINIFSGAA